MLLSVLVVGCGGGGEADTDTDTDDSIGATEAGPSTTASTSGSGGTTGSSSTSSATSTATESTVTTNDATSDPTLTSGETSEDSSSSTGADPDFPDVDVSDPQLYEFELDPQELDPTTDDALALQYAHLDTRAEPLGKLVFFLSGYTNTPAAWRNFGVHLAGYGFHVVEPHYANDWTCDGSPDCSTNTRWEALIGEDHSPVIDISRADSAEGRVVAILEHLDTVHPGGDWGFYLDGAGGIRYEHVIIAGISHGASSSGLFATRRPFSRAVMHSGGWWSVDETTMTPVDLMFGLSHIADEQHSGHLDAWEAAGLPGAPTTADTMDPPYGDSHRLIVQTPNGYPHCSVVVSPDSPIVDDEYVFDPAWRYMYGAL